MNVLVFLDGVLKNDSGAPILQGVALFRSLQAQRRTLILCDEKEPAEVWLLNNKITKLDDLVAKDVTGVERDVILVEQCRSRGPVDLVVTADPELATELIELGITVSLFLSPKYMRPEFRPDISKGAKIWADLTAELDRQNDLYREDPRA